MRCTSSLYMAIWKPLMCWFALVEGRCGNLSPLLFSVKLGLATVSGENMFFQSFLMYRPDRNLSFWVICASDMPNVFHIMLDNLWLIWLLDRHLLHAWI